MRRHFRSKPPAQPYAINRDSWQAEALLAWFPMADPGSGGVFDLSGQYTLISPNAPAWRSGGFDCAATGRGAEMTLPTALRIPRPLTLAVFMEVVGSPDQFANIVALTANNTDSFPFVVHAVTNVNGNFTMQWWSDSQGDKFTTESGVTLSSKLNAAPFWLVFTDAPASHLLYIDGTLAAQDTNSHGTNANGYSSTSMLAIGNYTGTNRSSGIVIHEARVYGRVLSPTDVVALCQPGARFDLYAERRWAASKLSQLLTLELGGTITPAGALSKQAGKTVSGTITPAGALIKSALKSLAGSIAPSGALAKAASKLFEGIITLAGNLIRLIPGQTASVTVTITDEAVTTCTITDEAGG